MKANVILLFIALWFTNLSHCQIISFYKESVTMELDATHLDVTAYLYFRNNNNQDKDQAVFYPYSCHGKSIKVDTMTMVDMTKNVSLKPSRKNIAGALYTLNFSPKEEKKLKVDYIQDHDGQTTGYILTKVRYLNGPLSQANYKLILVSPEVEIDSTSFVPDSRETVNGKMTLEWHKSNFMPDKELCIYFHMKK